jgi:hypothetical protein
MKLQYSVVVIILGIGLASLAILTNSQIQQNAVGQMDSEIKTASPSGANMTGNMTGNNMTGQSIPTANTTGAPSDVPFNG